MAQEIANLESLQNTSRPFKRRKVVGRGPGSKRGKTSGRGVKGMGSRSGYKTTKWREGGGVPLFKRLPTRGFSRGRFQKKLDVINLDRISELYNDNEVVNMQTLREKGYIKGFSHGIKILGFGTLTKKVKFEVDALSEQARAKLEQAGINV